MQLSLASKIRSSGFKSLDGNTFSFMINLSGRRRFTSQRITLFALLASLGHPGALDVSRKALKLFEEAHKWLVDGNEQLPGIFCDELTQAYFGPNENDRKIRAFVELAHQTHRALELKDERASELLAELITSSTVILAVLNELTLLYEELAKLHARKIRDQLTGIMSDIEAIAKEARMVSFNAQIVAARAGDAGREFSVVAKVLTDITGRIDTLIQQAVSQSSA